MVMNRLDVTFEGPSVSENGVPIEDLHMTLRQVQKAVRRMVAHLSGREYQRGRPPEILRQESMLRLHSTSPGSVVVKLGLNPPPDSQMSMGKNGSNALDQILDWQEDRTDNGDFLPAEVADELIAIGPKLSPEIDLVRIGDPTNGRCIDIGRITAAKKISYKNEKVLLHGWLKAINWDNGTAQLHRYQDQYVKLNFDASFNTKMKQLAMLYVRVQGRGRLNHDDSWIDVQLEQINETRSWQEPFDLEAFKHNPNPKIFDPENLVTVSEPFDIDEFLKIIYKSRDS